MKGTLDFIVPASCAYAPRTGGKRVVQRPWLVVTDPTDLYTRRIFGKMDVAGTLFVGGWPPGIIFRDLYDTLDWWEVVETEEGQHLVSRAGDTLIADSGMRLVVQ